MHIPNIDFSGYDEDDLGSLVALAAAVDKALSSGGFMSVTNVGVDTCLRNRMFTTSKAFFSQSIEDKSKCAYTNAEDNFGYQAYGQEHLAPGTPGDAKETFTMRNIYRYDADDSRWPSAEFRSLVNEFYGACLAAARRIQRVFAVALETERDFFVGYHSGENITLRLLRYPATASGAAHKNQLGAGAHTDYGMITLLFQDGVPGLELRDRKGQWHAVGADPDKILINTGDLMERWTNGRFRSTPHRVQPKLGQEERYSIAMFVDPDSKTPVETLPSCIDSQNPNKYPPITAGEHILQKIQASHY